MSFESFPTPERRRIPQAVPLEKVKETLTVEQAKEELLRYIRAFAAAHPDALVRELQGSLSLKLMTVGAANRKNFELAIGELRENLQGIGFDERLSEALPFLEIKNRLSH